MSWYGIDAVDKAFLRARKALLEPFSFWKWVKLAIIILLIGGANFGNSGTNYRMGSEDLTNNLPNTGPIPGNVPQDISIKEISSYVTSFPNYELLIAAIAGLILLILLFSYISSVMEFVFVESLVRNQVKFWAYSRRFLGKGFYLFLVRLILGLIIIALFAIAFLPVVLTFFDGSPDFSVPFFVGGIFFSIGIIIVLVLLSSIIYSFISLAIPLSIYQEKGILSAVSLVFAKFRKSWQQVLVYWFIRILLWIGIAIIKILFFSILLLGFGLFFLIIDGILYFLFSALVSDPINWILLVPFILIELILLIGALFLLNVPFEVFLKYHLLSFLEAWFVDSDIPFFDAPALKSEPAVRESELNGQSNI
jgi:hypothetical protein